MADSPANLRSSNTEFMPNGIIATPVCSVRVHKRSVWTGCEMKPFLLYEDHLFYWGVYLNMADNTKLEN
jgi:hypothetical protein